MISNLTENEPQQQPQITKFQDSTSQNTKCIILFFLLQYSTTHVM